MVVAWKSLKKTIRKRRQLRNKVTTATPNASIAEPENKQSEPTTIAQPDRAEFNESTAPAQTEKPRQQGLFLVSDRLPKSGGSGGESFGVDIIAIHGLNGDPYRTWTDGETRLFWLGDLLPDDIPGARIFTYGYPSHLLCSTSRARISDFAETLLAHVESRRVANDEQRPIIFVAHSLGGIVCKRALIMAKENPAYHDIVSNTIGILFFGTPHRGAVASPEMGIFLGQIVNLFMDSLGARLFLGRTRTDLIENLKRNSENLEDTAMSFRHVLSGKLKIITIYESAETVPLGRLV